MFKNKSLLIIFFTVFVDLLGFGIVIPIIPNFASHELQVSDTNIGIIIAIYSFIQFLFNPVVGKLSDKFGRRPVIISTLLISSFAYMMFSIADSFWILFLSRAIAGLGGSNLGAAQAYIADVTSVDERAKGMGLIGMAFGLGFVMGPVIGGFLAEFGYFWVGFASAITSLIASLIAVFYLKESLPPEKRSHSELKIKIFDIKTARGVLRTPVLGSIILLFFIGVFAISNIYGTLTLLGVRQFNFTNSQVGFLFGIMGGMGIFIQGFLIGKIIRHFNEKKLFVASIVFLMVGLFLIPLGHNFTGVSVALVILSFGSGIIQPVAFSLISKMADEKHQGTVMGINQSMASLGRVLGPVWGGFSYDYIGYQYPFFTGAFFMLIALFISINVIRKL